MHELYFITLYDLNKIRSIAYLINEDSDLDEIRQTLLEVTDNLEPVLDG